MISKVLVILSKGLMCYSKTFFGHDNIDDDFISGFLSTILDISQKIGGGEINRWEVELAGLNQSNPKSKVH